jgi:stress response protein YsnF/sporulation protein YlmC with PRC-barrel domain
MNEQQMTLDKFVGSDLHDREGAKIGPIEDVYFDEQTGKPEWFAVSTGFFGSKHGFVPIQGTTDTNNTLTSAFTKDQVKKAPHVEADGKLSQEEEAELYKHYGVGYSEQHSETGLPAKGEAPTKPSQTDRAMTRSEEEVNVGTRQQAAGKARLRKVVETEHKTITVPIKRETVEVVTEPITDANRDQAMKGADISEGVHEETLYEEVPVVETKVVAKERVHLQKETTTDEQQVDVDLRKEKIDVENDAATSK